MKHFTVLVDEERTRRIVNVVALGSLLASAFGQLAAQAPSGPGAELYRRALVLYESGVVRRRAETLDSAADLLSRQALEFRPSLTQESLDLRIRVRGARAALDPASMADPQQLRAVAADTSLDDTARAVAVYRLARDANALRFIRGLVLAADSAGLRRTLVAMVAGRESRHLNWLLELARDPVLDAATRAYAVTLAGENGAGVASLAAVYDATRASRAKPDVAVAALDALGASTEQAALDKLMAVADSEDGPHLRSAAVLAMASHAADPRLREFLRHLAMRPL
jgi:hypothetical protein